MVLTAKEKTFQKVPSKTPVEVKVKSSKSRDNAVKSERFYATGKRKEAISRTWLKLGSGKITINGRDIEQYFARPVLRMIINQPFEITKTTGQYDVECTITGSGLSGQAGALRLGISRALNNIAEEFHPLLRKNGFLTRDSRKVERKKFGRKKARKSFQFSKR